MRKVLVSGASGVVGYGVLRSLRKSGRELCLIGTSIYDDSVAQGFCDVFELAPPTSDPAYLEWLLDVIGKHRIDLIIPGIEIDVFTWAEHAEEIEKSGAVVLLNNKRLIHLCRDKWSFFEHLKKAGIPCAIDSSISMEFSSLKEMFGLPFLLKPRHGYGSKGIVTVDSEESFQKHRQDMGSLLMAQPVVGSDDEEYTISAFCDGEGGFYACLTLKRRLSKEGFTEKAEVVGSDEFVETVLELCKYLHPIGPTNFQFRICSEGVKLLEINPRFSSATSIRTAFGFNESAMAVDFYLDHIIPVQPEIIHGRAVRYVEDYIYL